MTKAGFCAIVGRPSSGKSTLLNRVCGHHVSIVSPTPQTTRNKVRGIYTAAMEAPGGDGLDARNQGEGQIVFVDTPGFHNSEKKLNRYLRDLVTSALEDIDAVLYVVDTARPIGPEEEELAALLAHSEIPVLAALNKTDVATSRREELAEFVHRTLPNTPVLPISAETGDGLEELLDVIIDLMPESELLYPADYYTDQEPEFRIAEVLREQAILQTREELPHALYVEVADMEVRAAKPKRGEQKPRGPQETLWIRAFIVVERESQQGIVVGRGGERIHEIRTAAQTRLKELFDYQIYLDLRVKVQPKWRRTDAILDRLVH